MDKYFLEKVPSQLLQQLRYIVPLKPVKTTPSDYYSGGRVSVEGFGVGTSSKKSAIVSTMFGGKMTSPQFLFKSHNTKYDLKMSTISLTSQD